MQLSKIIEKVKESPKKIFNASIDPKIINICYDSRKIQPDEIFVAIKGSKSDGHDFIKEATNNGAAAIVYQNEVKIKNDIPYIKVGNTRKYLAEMACVLNDNPSDRLVMLGITGTNGKTTTSHIIKQIIKKTKYKPGIIGSIDNRFDSSTEKQLLTTPESLELQTIMNNMLAVKTTHLVLEVSSHALDLYRVHGCNFDIAIFTNLTQDHLDYHNNMEKYWHVKQKLFKKYLKKDGIAIINIDDIRGEELAEALSNKTKVITTGYKKKCDIKPYSFTYSLTGTQGKIITPYGNFNFHSPLLGDFNLNNILSATGASIAMGISLKAISNGINTTLPVPGRLDLLDKKNGIFVYIDYAHTPDALKKVIKTIRSIHKGRIITIFGCGGDRDSSKRSLMGTIAAKFSDLTIVTLDNPRFEDSTHINKQIINGIHQIFMTSIKPKILLSKGWKGKAFSIINDRKEAISIGIRVANTGDTVLIAGKGHETYQVIGHNTLKFDDKKEAINVLKNIIK